MSVIGPDYECDGCKYFKWVSEMGSHLPWCNFDKRYDPKKCKRFKPSKLYEMYLEIIDRED